VYVSVSYSIATDDFDERTLKVCIRTGVKIYLNYTDVNTHNVYVTVMGRQIGINKYEKRTVRQYESVPNGVIM